MRKKALISFIIVLSLLAFINLSIPTKIKADSGFDTSYDSGGGWDSGSDWSSSDWSSSSYDGTGSYDGNISVAELLFIIYGITCIIVVIILINKAQKNSIAIANPIKLDHSKEIEDEKVKEFIKDFEKESFLKERYNDYLTIQEDWMNFNYDGLRERLTDELYNQYEMQLETLKSKKQKNIMKNFIYDDSMITGISKENNQITINMELAVAFVDYIEQDGNIVRGNNRILVNQHYNLTFVLSETKIDTCPNCGAKLTNNSSQKCEYCGSIVSRVGNKAVLSKKESIKQR